MAYTAKEHQVKVNAFEDVAMSLRDLYDAKNQDYNDSFGQSFQKWGLPMACIRLGDKLNRLESFAMAKDMKVKDESLKDTLKDLASYAIMTLVELERADRIKSLEE